MNEANQLLQAFTVIFTFGLLFFRLKFDSVLATNKGTERHYYCLALLYSQCPTFALLWIMGRGSLYKLSVTFESSKMKVNYF